jgi:hypothetical protein
MAHLSSLGAPRICPSSLFPAVKPGMLKLLEVNFRAMAPKVPAVLGQIGLILPQNRACPYRLCRAPNAAGVTVLTNYFTFSVNFGRLA